LAGEKIHFDPVLLDELKESTEFEMAQKLITVTSSNLNIVIPTDEIGYVTMHLQGAKFRSTKEKDASFRIHDYEIIHFAEQLVQIMERKAGMILSDNKRLLTDLVNHMGPAFTRIRMGMVIRNPLLEQIKKQYLTYYKWTEEAVEYIEKRLGNKIPDDEIGYLTMHFGAAIESSIKRRNLVWRVIIACSTGIGSSKLLESRVAKLYKNIKIVSVRSTLNIERAILAENVDFVISTVRLKQTLVPTVVVSPLLLDEDAKRIEEMLSAIKPKQVQNPTGKEHGLVSRLAQITLFSKTSEAILKNYFLKETEGDTMAQIIEDAAAQIKTDHRGQLVKDLNNREELGRTPVGQDGILLHCRSKAVTIEQFGFLKVNNPALGITFVVVMVVPNQISEVSRSLLGTLTQKVVELDSWVQEVKNGAVQEAYLTLEQIIGEELKTVLQILEDTNE
jgi:mannitol operon transcriptional antiterminator